MRAAIPAVAAAEEGGRGRFALLSELFKVRLTALVLMTTAVGFHMGSRGGMDWIRFTLTMLGTGLLACGASALNQWLERRPDGLMRRTQDRPLPSGQMQPAVALRLGVGIAAAGLLVLELGVGRLTAVLGGVTLLVYVLVYTPLKRVTTLNTVVGAVPGALPPVIGWTASLGVIDPEGWSLFALMVFWQLPHFLAIAWMYREDYARAGFVMLAVYDATGERTGARALAHTVGLVAVSLAPFALGMAGALYLAGALGLGGMFLWHAVRFSREPTVERARRLFYVSILYLPLLLGFLMLGRN